MEYQKKRIHTGKNALKKHIIEKLEKLNWGLDSKWVNLQDVADHCINNLTDHATEYDLDNLISDYCATKSNVHPDYKLLAGRVVTRMLHTITSGNILEVYEKLNTNKDNLSEINENSPLVTDEMYNIVKEHHLTIQAMIDYTRDYLFDYFGIKTLQKGYLFKILTEDSEILVERPQHLFMRVALQLHGTNFERVKETYDLISELFFTHATPTLYNAGTKHAQMSSCYVLEMLDNLENIYDTKKEIALISKWSGGIGVCLSNIRCKGSKIRGTNGKSSGIIPLCMTLDRDAKYVNQGGKRNGAIACYLEPWHGDIYEFCELRKNTGDSNLRTRDLFLGLWIPDLFMQRVKEDKEWSLMCPDQCPGLVEAYGKKFEALYIQYEKEGKFRKKVRAKDLWLHILECQIETGMPYIGYKDNVNEKSNHKNIGTIKCSNLCIEINEYFESGEPCVCNLASISLPKFVEYDADGNAFFNYEKLLFVSKVITRNMNIVIDKNYYPTSGTKSSNMRNRPVGIGVQGLTDVFELFKVEFGSEEARIINRKIFETIYYGCIYESNQLAIKYGHYETFKGSPFSKGKLQMQLWKKKDNYCLMGFDWTSLIESVKTHGTRNSLLTAVMPTATTSQIMGNTECIEPKMTNFYLRDTSAGEFPVINGNLIKDLIKLGIWNDEIRDEILYDNGSVQNIEEIPRNVKDLYKTAFETRQKDIITQAIERGPFIDQSQSMNIFMAEPDFNKLHSAHFYGWENGLKTGIYYLKSLPATDPVKFGIDPDRIRNIQLKRMRLSKLKHGATQHHVPVTKAVPEKPLDKEEDKDEQVFEDAPKACPLRRPGDLGTCGPCSS